LVDLSAEQLGLRVTYDEATLKSKVTLRQDRPIADAELWQLTNRLLADQGLTTIRSGDDSTLAVVKVVNAAQAARVERVEDVRDDKGVQAGFRRVLIPLRRAASKDILAAVQLVLSKPGGVASDSEQAGLVMIADLTPSLNAALALVEQLDGTEGGAVVRHVPARNIDPTRLATLTKQLADRRKAVGGRELRGDVVPSGNGTSVTLIAPPALLDQWMSIIADADQREPVERRTYTTGAFGLKEVANLIEQTVRTTGASPAGFPQSSPGSPSGIPDDRWKLVLDELTGTLIVTALPAQHDQISELLAGLSRVPAEARRPLKMFSVHNRPVREIQQLVEELLRAGILDANGGDAPPGPGQGDPPNPSSALGSQTTTRPFAPGGSLLPGSPSPGTPTAADATAPQGTALGTTRSPPSLPGARARLGLPALTLTCDEATGTLIAVGDPRLLSQLERLLPTLDVRQSQVMLEAFLVSLTDSQTLSLGVELERVQVSGDTFIRLASLFGLSTAAGSGAAATRAVGDATGFTGVVLNPGDFSVVVKALETLNKGRALSSPKLLVSNNQQATFNSVLQQPFATTNASTTVATTAFGGTQDAGTTISVKPQIAQGDHLTLTYSVALSSFTGVASSANLPPPRQQNTVQSVATIPDGYTVVVGGLENTSEGNDASQVPGLGSIPLIGELFKSRGVSHSRTRFYVFVRASILRSTNFEDLKHLSDGQSTSAGIDDGWPAVEPRLIGGRP
jgi:type II secretory pathway component GspD/PulD (secretin)